MPNGDREINHSFKAEDEAGTENLMAANAITFRKITNTGTFVATEFTAFVA